MRRTLMFVCFVFIAWTSLSPFPLYGKDTQEGQTSSRGVKDESYRLQTGDRVLIKIYPDDEYLKNTETEISSEGNVTLPLLGKISVGGKTVLEAQRDIVVVLSKDYLVNPEVVIEVLEYKKKSFVILGQVKSPGSYEMPAGEKSITLLKAISMAGGFSEIANTKKIKIMRKGADGNQMIQANADDIMSGKEPDIELETGDVVHVSESLF